MSIFDSISHGIGRLSDSPFSNPNKIFGLDLWGREQPGGPADQWENKFQNRTGLPTATIGRYNQHYGPQTAGMIAGGILAGGGAAASELPAGSGGAMDMGGSAGVFDSQGTPLYHSPSAGMGMQQHGMSGGGQRQPQMGPRPHDYLAYLQGQPAQTALGQPLGQGTFWGGGQSPMAKGLFGYG